ncbi:zinc-ribbon domain-containing protein [Geomonas terrae]|uniref:Zinc-ribbon domain-containing protein n=1 Tax=Geomonas terrae TaxID=2562681 RepID=A0A4S1CD99_9BACT|nr:MULTISPECIES: PLDc N-terminal domain-containing protein [Geomonas]TGU71425.1 zinc-ribbon domain-containing protein [Geomonas terrae]
MFGFGLPELIVLLFTLTPLVLWVVALVDIIRSEFSGNNKIIWILVVVLLPLLGAILYFFVGRKQKVTSAFDSVTASGRRFCSDCGEEVNPRAEICPNCGVRHGSQRR